MTPSARRPRPGTPAKPVHAPRGNWSGTVEYGFRDASRPTTTDEVRRVVTAHDHLRVVGTGHTFNAVTDGDHALLMDRFTDVEPTPDGTSVWVGGGATYADVALALRPHGLALRNLASLPHISVAGAVATATHGSGLTAGNLATHVRSLELVTGTGELLTLHRGEPDHAGAVVSLGSLGVVTRLELDVEQDRPWRQVVLEGLPEPEISSRLEALHSLARSVSIFLRWDGEPARVWLKRREGDPSPPPSADLLQAAEEHHPIAGLDPVHCTPQLDEPGWWADRVPHFLMGFMPSNGDESQSEYHVAREHGPAAVEALRGIGAEIAAAAQTTEIRAVAADDLWLSPQHGQGTWSFHFTWSSRPAAAERAAAAIEEALAPLGARPHWGKVFHHAPRPERLDDFRVLRERLDPDERFVNDWVRRVLLTD
ncbi:FAD-binding protein [Aeromicrobium sp. CTD01-1L150]|uniref:FAD-binding protein n=1 Tax=Aeromicrobium sp. CTD01-1L150 TaxID=3341830 RepID=UPI0035C22455